MALSNQVFDFADFLRFSCYQILWNSDFFEETHMKTFKCSSFRSNETILVIFKHCERFFSTLIYLQSVVGFRKSQKSCSWINRDLCVPCREICLEKLFFPWCISRRFWKKILWLLFLLLLSKFRSSQPFVRKWLLKKRFQIHWSQFGSLPIWSKYSNRVLAPALFGIFPSLQAGAGSCWDAGVGVHNIALPPSQLKLSIHKFRHGFGTLNNINKPIQRPIIRLLGVNTRGWIIQS